MPRNRIIVFLGALIATFPILGFPHKWEAFFQIFAGLGIVGLSVWTTIDRKLTMKAKAQKRNLMKRQTIDMVREKTVPETPVDEEWLEVTETEADTNRS